MLVATSAAFSPNPLAWFAEDAPSGSSVVPQSVVAPAPTPTSTWPPGAVPNYRGIVQQGGPAVVGITVAGSRNLGPDELVLNPSDPFYQFFHGLPGFQFRLPGPGRGGNIPFRSVLDKKPKSIALLILRDGNRIFVPVELG